MRDLGEISDGLGDLAPADLVALHEPLARIIAAERQTPDAPYEDLVQEARISIWSLARARAGQRDDLRGLASVAIRRRVNDLVTRQTWTGYEKAGGRTAKADPMRSSRESMDAIIEAVGADVFGGVEALSGVEMAYHEGEISAALADLAEHHREYVYLRFWGGWTQPEIAESMGTTLKTVDGWWTRVIKPTLRTALAHLGAP